MVGLIEGDGHMDRRTFLSIFGVSLLATPIVQPAEFKLALNVRTAKALGLTVPPSMVSRADQVIR